MFKFKKNEIQNKKTCNHELTVPNFSYATGQLP